MESAILRAIDWGFPVVQLAAYAGSRTGPMRKFEPDSAGRAG
jgi:hypothetical protein